MRRPLARSLVLGRPGLFYGSAVRDYLDRVRAADGAGLERSVTNGINTYISGLITANMLGTSGGVISQAASTIKAHCILAGANTLSGCLVPVVGAAPTNFNFVPADCLRKTGVKGNGTTKYLDSNRNNTADPQDSRHIAVYMTDVNTSNPSVIIGTSNITGRTSIVKVGAVTTARLSALTAPANEISPVAGFLGGVRTSATAIAIRNNSINIAATLASEAPASETMGVFATGLGTNLSNPRLAFYSIGESLDLAILQSLQDQLMATFAAAIP